MLIEILKKKSPKVEGCEKKRKLEEVLRSVKNGSCRIVKNDTCVDMVHVC